MESIDRIVDQSAIRAFPTITIDAVISNLANIVNDDSNDDSKIVSSEASSIVAILDVKTD